MLGTSLFKHSSNISILVAKVAVVGKGNNDDDDDEEDEEVEEEEDKDGESLGAETFQSIGVSQRVGLGSFCLCLMNNKLYGGERDSSSI